MFPYIDSLSVLMFLIYIAVGLEYHWVGSLSVVHLVCEDDTGGSALSAAGMSGWRGTVHSAVLGGQWRTSGLVS